MKLSNCSFMAIVLMSNLVLFTNTIGSSPTVDTTSAPSSTPLTTTTNVTLTTTTTTTTTTTKPTTTKPPMTSSQSPIRQNIDGDNEGDSSPAPPKNVSTKDIDEMRKSIQQKMDLNHGENRLSMNRPASPSIMHDFAADSMESRVAEATNQFGLEFMKTLIKDKENQSSKHENTVISPLSLQNLLNMLLLGSKDNSPTYKELVKALGYDKTDLLPIELAKDSTTNDRLKPHEAMKSLIQSIQLATHLIPNAGQMLVDPMLLNTNPASLPVDSTSVSSSNGDAKEEKTTTEKKINLEAHLQTSNRDQSTLLSEQVNFTLANLVLTNKDLIHLLADYEKDLTSYYNVKVEEFSSPDDKKMTNEIPLHDRVNNWVKNMTQNQIDKLVEKGDLDGGDLAMILLNAAHFKGRWLHTFNPKATTEGVFYNDGDEVKTVQVQYMRQKALFGYADFTTASLMPEPYTPGRIHSSDDSETLTMEDSSPTSNIVSTPASGLPTLELSKEDTRKMELVNKLNCSVLMMPFSLNDGQELSMIIMLPAKRDGVYDLQKTLTAPILNEIYRLIVDQQVKVELPKFSFESSHDAKAVLEQLGVAHIFQAPAHLDRMLTTKNPQQSAKVDKIIHKAKINVDETGAEAAAASMATIVLRNFVRPPTSFIVDRPFIFIIRHNRSNMPLFMGRVNRL